jgi:hypothetical protein
MAGPVRVAMLAGIGVALMACEGPPPVDAIFFEDEAACRARFDEFACARARDEAATDYQAQAPVWLTRGECETEFGRNNCTPRYMPSNRPYYAPAMMGFLTDGRIFSEPVYAEVDGTALVLRGGSLYRVGRFVLPPPTVIRKGMGHVIREPASPAEHIGFLGMTPEQVSANGWEGR